jgi:hypothetical protein
MRERNQNKQISEAPEKSGIVVAEDSPKLHA